MCREKRRIFRLWPMILAVTWSVIFITMSRWSLFLSKVEGQELCRRTRYRQPMTTSRGADAVRVIGVGRPGRPVYLHEDSQLLSGTPCKRCLLNRGQCRHQPSQPRNEPVGPFYMSGNKHWGSCQDRPSPAPDRAAGSLPASSGHTCSTTARNSSDMTSIASLSKRDR